MTRTFHHRITVGAVCGIVLLLALSFYAFWIKAVVVGLLLVLALVLVAESALRTEYVFSGDKLIICRGRLSRNTTIELRTVTSCRPMTTVFGLVRYLLITCGADGRVVSVQPDNEAAFVKVMREKMLWKDED